MGVPLSPLVTALVRHNEAGTAARLGTFYRYLRSLPALEFLSWRSPPPIQETSNDSKINFTVYELPWRVSVLLRRSFSASLCPGPPLFYRKHRTQSVFNFLETPPLHTIFFFSEFTTFSRSSRCGPSSFEQCCPPVKGREAPPPTNQPLIPAGYFFPPPSRCARALFFSLRISFFPSFFLRPACTEGHHLSIFLFMPRSGDESSPPTFFFSPLPPESPHPLDPKFQPARLLKSPDSR